MVCGRTHLSTHLFAPMLIASLLLVAMPWDPRMPQLGLATSWRQTLEYAFEAHLQYGRDLVFAYGPLGFAQISAYSPGTYLWVLAIRGSMLVVLGLFYFKLLRRLPIAYGAAVAFTVVAASSVSKDFASGAVPVVATLVLFDDNVSTADSAGLAFLCGVTSLMKFTYFSLIVAVYLMTTLYGAFRRRVYPIPLALWLLALALLYLLAGQNLSLFWEFFRGSLSMATGYSEAMQSYGPQREVYYFCLLAGTLLAIFAVSELRDRGAWALFPTCALALIVFVSFKEGFVRHDFDHQSIAVPWLIVNIAICAGWMSRRRLNLAAAALFVVAVGYFFISVAGPAQLIRVAANKLSAMGELAENGTRPLDDRYQQALARVRQEAPLPKVSGDTDIYPFEQSALLASGNRYNPRPEFQSLTAYTSYLIQRNVDFLKQSAPKTVFFDIAPIDGRLAAFEDGASWPELLTRYNIANSSHFLQLDRRDFPGSYLTTPMLKTLLDFEEPLKIGNDDDSMIWAHIDLQQTLAGRLLTALTKAPIVNLEATFRDGRVRQYRILPAAAAAGFLLSPVVENRFDFLALQRPEIRAYLSKNRIKTIRLLPQPSIIPAYRNRVPVTLERLSLKVILPSPQGALAAVVRSIQSLVVLDAGEKNGL